MVTNKENIISDIKDRINELQHSLAMARKQREEDWQYGNTDLEDDLDALEYIRELKMDLESAKSNLKEWQRA